MRNKAEKHKTGICKYCGTPLPNYRDFCDQWCRKEYNDNNQDEQNGVYHVPV